jgi:hypothetical protein
VCGKAHVLRLFCCSCCWFRNGLAWFILVRFLLSALFLLVGWGLSICWYMTIKNARGSEKGEEVKDA